MTSRHSKLDSLGADIKQAVVGWAVGVGHNSAGGCEKRRTPTLLIMLCVYFSVPAALFWKGQVHRCWGQRAGRGIGNLPPLGSAVQSDPAPSESHCQLLGGCRPARIAGMAPGQAQAKVEQTAGPALMALRLQGQETPCAPKEAQWPSRKSVAGNEELLHFNWVGRQRSNLMSKAHPCNTLLQHWVIGLCIWVHVCLL